MSPKPDKPTSTTRRRSPTKRAHQPRHKNVDALSKSQVEDELLATWLDTSLPFPSRYQALVAYGKERHKMFKDRKVTEFDLTKLVGQMSEEQQRQVAGMEIAGELEA